jgi:hypothetical protein
MRAITGFLTLGLSAGLVGCIASKQPIPLECVPEEVSIYVDGKLLEDHPDSITLSRDESHKIFLKRPGYEPELLVLESLEGPDGKPVLSNADVCVELVPIGLGRELTLEGENDVEAP